MTVTFAPVRLVSERIDEAAAMMGRAAVNDPCLVYPLPDPVERARCVSVIMRMYLKLYLTKGEIWATPGPAAGAALWRPPAATKSTPEEMATAGMDEIAVALGPVAFSRFQDMLAGFAEVGASAPTRPCWYLAWICVEPAEQGRGIGGTLIREIAARADAEGAVCRLSNFVPGNLAIYNRLGFRVIDETTMSKTGLHVWTMEREPLVQG